MGEATTRLDSQVDFHATRIGQAGDVSGLEVNAVGLRFGLDRKVRPFWVAGGSLGFCGGNADGTDPNPARGDFSAFLAIAQTELRWRRIAFHINGGYIGQQTRLTSLGLTSHKDGHQGNLGFGIAIPNEIGFVTVEPVLAFRHVFVTESPRGTATPDTAPRSDDLPTLLIGGRYAIRYATPLSTVLPSVEAYWLHDLHEGGLVSMSDRDNIVPAHLYRRAAIPTDRLLLGVGVASRMGRSLDLALRYTVQMGSNLSHHALAASMNWNF